MDCPDCERLQREENDASIELVGADETLPAEVSDAEYARWQRRKSAAEARLQAARERTAAHRAWHRVQTSQNT